MSSRTLLVTRALVILGLAAVLNACSGQKFGIQAQNEEFGQRATYNTEVEILWVIDSSGSMAKHQGLLADQAGLFLDALNQTELNYQIGVTTMDMSGSGARGRFLYQAGTPGILKPTTSNLLPLFQARLRAGETGSMLERGQEAMKAALELNSAAGSSNAGFLRPNSLLVVIFLSNEEDKSVEADYATYLDQIRPPLPSGERSWIAHFMGVMPNDANCKTSEWNFSSSGQRYIKLVESSGGVSESICDADLRRALTNVKARILEVITEFPLEGKPSVASLEVWIDGVKIAQETTNGWSYNSATNAIRFHGAAVPKPGAMIKVKFDPATLD